MSGGGGGGGGGGRVGCSAVRGWRAGLTGIGTRRAGRWSSLTDDFLFSFLVVFVLIFLIKLYLLVFAMFFHI